MSNLVACELFFWFCPLEIRIIVQRKSLKGCVKELEREDGYANLQQSWETFTWFRTTLQSSESQSPVGSKETTCIGFNLLSSKL